LYETYDKQRKEWAMNRNRYLRAVATIAVLLTSGALGSAQAGIVNFSWSPEGVGLTNDGTAPVGTTNILNANNYNIADFASNTVNTNTGAFTETGYLNILNFLNGGTTASSIGLGSSASFASIPGYSLYLSFNGSGTTALLPTVAGNSSDGTFSLLNYTLIGTPNAPVSFTVNNGSVTTTDPGPDTVLGYGSLIPGSGILTTTKTANGYSPTANASLAFNQCMGLLAGTPCTADESAFFLAPLTGLDLQVGNFSATDTVTSLTVAGPDTAYLNVNGGGGNLTFIAVVPEPASAALLGAGLICLAGIVRLRCRL
jgi:hypothetical protein